MFVEKIVWMEESAKEAIVTVTNGNVKVICFSQPCTLNVGSKIEEPLECIDTLAVTVCESKPKITKRDSFFEYEFQGKIVNREKGLVNVAGLIIHVNVDDIPNDVNNGMYIAFGTSRLDI